MRHMIGGVIVAVLLAGCCTGSYQTRGNEAPPDFIIQYPVAVSIDNEIGAKTRIPIEFVNSAERTICLGEPKSNGGWRCGYRPELIVRISGENKNLSAAVETNGLLRERIKRGRSASPDGRFFAELTLTEASPNEIETDVCLELVLRDEKGLATTMSRAGGPVKVMIGRAASSDAPQLAQPSEMTSMPVTCGFGGAEDSR